jgi:hypothetical protein
MRFSLPIALIGAACLLTANAEPARAQAFRTWVSGVGDDVNPCARTAPCKTFAGAISKTAAFGEINCLDSGGFGAVTITKSITIDCGEALGSILAGGSNGINVNGANIIVSIRNLSINGAGGGIAGINFTNGSALEVHNVTIFGFIAGNAQGIRFTPQSGNSLLLVSNSTIMTNGIAPSTGGGIGVQTAGGTAEVVIQNTRIENNSVGVTAVSSSGAIKMTVRESIVATNQSFGILSTAAAAAINLTVERTTVIGNLGTGVLSQGASSMVRIDRSIITGNATGVGTAGGGVLRSYKNNAINGNATEGTPIPPQGLN